MVLQNKIISRSFSPLFKLTTILSQSSFVPNSLGAVELCRQAKSVVNDNQKTVKSLHRAYYVSIVILILITFFFFFLVTPADKSVESLWIV